MCAPLLYTLDNRFNITMNYSLSPTLIDICQQLVFGVNICFFLVYFSGCLFGVVLSQDGDYWDLWWSYQPGVSGNLICCLYNSWQQPSSINDNNSHRINSLYKHTKQANTVQVIETVFYSGVT